MTNQTTIQVLLDKLKAAFRDRDPLPKRLDPASSEVAPGGQPELPLEIGSELLITDEIVKLYKGLTNARGRVVLVDQLSTKEHRAIKASAFGIQVNVNPENAQHMRAAYLRREQA